MCRWFVVFVFAATAASAQTYVVKDRNGVPTVAISDVEMFRYSEYFGKRVPEFRATVKNIVGREWSVTFRDVPISVTVHRKDGSSKTFLAATDLGFLGGFLKDATASASHTFEEPFPYTEADFASVAFAFPKSWKSPEDERRAATAQARRSAEAQSKLAAERARMRAPCMRIYVDTSSSRVGDLTVMQGQQVRRCEALGLYPPGGPD